jgi:hypothetical protein
MKALGRPVIVSFLRSVGVVGDGTPDLAQLVLTGVSAADSVVSLFDGLPLLGSTTADASGIWRFTIGAFSDEIHSFTAVATNAAGEMSAASPAVRVTAVMNRIASLVPDAAAVGDSIANAGVLINGAADANLLHRVMAIGTDAPGNTGAASNVATAATVTVADGAPSITAVGTGSVAEPVSGVTTVIGDGAMLELAYAYSGTITFAGATGTLICDNSSSFSGTIAGQLAKGNVIDLALV